MGLLQALLAFDWTLLQQRVAYSKIVGKRLNPATRRLLAGHNRRRQVPPLSFPERVSQVGLGFLAAALLPVTTALYFRHHGTLNYIYFLQNALHLLTCTHTAARDFHLLFARSGALDAALSEAVRVVLLSCFAALLSVEVLKSAGQRQQRAERLERARQKKEASAFAPLPGDRSSEQKLKTN